MKKIKLILEDKSEYEGYAFGAPINSSGEVVFTTGMVGYPESLTDPSFRGQILISTYPLVGNYGVPREEVDQDGLSKHFESHEVQIKGLVVSEYSDNHNHWQSQKSLGEWLAENNVPGITGIDTRALTQKIRTKGAMLGKIVYDEKEKTSFYDPNKENLVEQVSTKEVITYQRGRRNITVIRVPWDYDIFEKGLKYNGIFVSNGPGDPAMAKATIENIRKAFEKKIPTFGICLGLQLMALAAGAKTYKLKFGHRGQNQPSIDVETNRCFITSQNHGFAVKEDSIPSDWNTWMVNANDKTIEGIKHKKHPFFAVQFHPENAPGPTDCEYLFDQFIQSL